MEEKNPELPVETVKLERNWTPLEPAGPFKSVSSAIAAMRRRLHDQFEEVKQFGYEFALGCTYYSENPKGPRPIFCIVGILLGDALAKGMPSSGCRSWASFPEALQIEGFSTPELRRFYSTFQKAHDQAAISPGDFEAKKTHFWDMFRVAETAFLMT